MKNIDYFRLVLVIFLIIVVLAACDPDETLDQGDPTETIVGSVWSDDNRNGVWDDGEEGVPDVVVWLNSFGIRDEFTVTNGDGFYEFEVPVDLTKIGQDVYEVEVLPSTGYSLTDQNVGDNGEIDPRDDSDVDQNTGKAQHPSGWFTDAGLVPAQDVVEANQEPSPVEDVEATTEATTESTEAAETAEPEASAEPTEVVETAEPGPTAETTEAAETAEPEASAEPNDDVGSVIAHPPVVVQVEVERDPSLQDCTTGETYETIEESNARILKARFRNPFDVISDKLVEQYFEDREQHELIVTLVDEALNACTSYDLLGIDRPFPTALPEWFFSDSANDTSGGLCNGEVSISHYDGNEWVPTSDSSATITREGDEVTFVYPVEWLTKATHLYIGGVDFDLGQCTQLGLDQNGVGGIPLKWDIDHWGPVIQISDKLGFGNISAEFPFSAEDCSAEVNIFQEWNGDGLLIHPTLDRIDPINPLYSIEIVHPSGQPFENGCESMMLDGILNLDVEYAN